MRAAVTRRRAPKRPTLGFLGTGWIGRHRLEAALASGAADIAAVADPSRESRQAAAAIVPGAEVCERLDQLLDRQLDGVVIATPSALHAEHSVAALERGAAVFCQKPLARTAGEAAAVVAAARAADRLLGVDLCYRHTAAVGAIRSLIRAGKLGRVYAASLIFHNAYGPDKAWFYDRAASGGGCVIDLGIHLIDLAMWLLGSAPVGPVRSHLFAAGARLNPTGDEVEDHAAIQLELAGDVSVQLACSWRLAAGRDAVIEAHFHGTEGGAAMLNIDGSFYDFTAERYRGTRTETLTRGPDAWGGRALIEWAERLAAGEGFDDEAEQSIVVHEVIDAIYNRA
jgi:predicted dehydrogenase